MKVLYLLAFVALAASLRVDTTINTKSDGAPRTLYGSFGYLRDLTPRSALHFIKSQEIQEVFGLKGTERFVYRNTNEHEVVHTFRFDQVHNGLRVNGGEIALFVTPATREVHGISGNVLRSAPAKELATGLTEEDVSLFVEREHTKFKIFEKPTLVYLIDDNDVAKLAWQVSVLSNKDSGVSHGNDTVIPEPYDIYIDAIEHEILMDIPRYRKGLFRQVFNTFQSQNLPGTLDRKEGQGAVSDTYSNQAYDNAGRCYFYYANIFSRDSWDNHGSPLNSTVHYGVKYNNAFWNGEQMVYGDGDGVIFLDFANDLSVICHELSHAVTQSSSNLRYFYESGALNEAFSDIMGSSSVVYSDDPVHDNPDPATAWIIGPNVTLINLNPSGCPDCPLGLRYMDNPTLDGSSKDYYPERYTGLQDNRGVHWNSGIANLAYVLTVQGGVHPRQKTSIFVQAVSIQKGQQIYYLANTQYADTTTDFSGFKVACEKAASALGYSNSVQQSTADAWTAVGVN